MPANPQSPSDGARRTLAVLVGSYALALVTLGVVLALLGAELASPPLWMVVTVLLATIAVWALAAVLPVSRAGSVASVTMRLTILRMALLEAPAILGFALAFVSSPTNLLIFVLPTIFALGGMWLLARPSVVLARVENAFSSP